MGDDFGAKAFGNRFMVPSLGRDSEGRPDDQPLDLVEISGSIKWFDVSKGFGFIEPEGGGGDVFAHFSAIQMDGFRTLKQGARVSYELVQGPKGEQAQNIQAAAEDQVATAPTAASA